MAPDLDVILLGHSIGGLIAADVALAESYTTAGHVPNSRIVGLVAFDTPFLGLHPRVIATAAGRVLGRKAKNESRRTSQRPNGKGGMERAIFLQNIRVIYLVLFFNDTRDSVVGQDAMNLVEKSETARKEQLWIPLRMEGMDEIAAHQSMFLPLGTYYDRLVADTVAKIESWLV
ncbi:hypothetical protein AKAW_06474 [Aspergillus luchuensis IFO 4308]|nr:hypothetical protein AKAW_06474 [Aspergillus luchuensis IFO 4308]